MKLNLLKNNERFIRNMNNNSREIAKKESEITSVKDEFFKDFKEKYQIEDIKILEGLSVEVVNLLSSVLSSSENV